MLLVVFSSSPFEMQTLAISVIVDFIDQYFRQQIFLSKETA
jgi:hypothetical protein